MFFSRFWQDRRGSVAPMFAIAVIPVIGLTGAAIDYSRANSARTGMQAAIDATALAMAKLAPTLTSDELKTKANAYFHAMFNHPEAKNIQVTPNYTTAGGPQLTVSVTGSVEATFMKIMGYDNMNIGSSSTVKWGNQRLRVALALDNTGSMASAGKIDALKTATNGLLTQLRTAATTNGDVYVSIIPFVKDVNVGAGNKGASWIDWSDWDNKNGTCSKGQGVTNYSDCMLENGKPKWTPASHDTWNGCVTDRGGTNTPTGQDYDTNANAPGSSQSSKFLAEQYGSCPQAVMPLSYDWTAMNTLVNNMSPGGNTNQAIGLAHAWMSLVGGGPYPTPPAKDPNYSYSDVIILLTDGLNTEDRWFTDQASIDARQTLTCSNVKAAGVTLYTIQVNTDADPTSALLQSCASTSDKFYLLTSASQMVTVFSQIGTNLSKLRIAK
ncbi:MAG: VWA domain-containing protein [Alphaproteobacteria bacterium]|nr:MAG: VWA domain-containing protein [Alphaproteobacteria bacterium]